MNDVVFKVKSYADDMILSVLEPIKMLQYVMEHFQEFESFSEYKNNNEILNATRRRYVKEYKV